MYRDFLNIKHYLVELTQCFLDMGKNLLAYSLYLKIGDKEYKYEDLLKYRTNTEGFEVVYPNNGIFGVLDGGPFMAVADGYYIMTDPLSKGNHTVHYKSSLSCLDPGCAEPNFAQDIKYNVIAK